MTDYIPLDECEDRHIYRIKARNFSIGVYNGNTYGFIGIREKISQHFLFEEYHYDTGAPFGTASPIEDIGTLPNDINLSLHIEGPPPTMNQILFEYLDKIETIESSYPHAT